MFLEVVFLVEHAFVFFDVLAFFLFVIIEVIVVVIIFVVIVGDLEIIWPGKDEHFAALRAAQLIAFFMVSCVNLVEFALGARRHSGSMQPIGRAAKIGKTAASISGYGTSRERPDYNEILMTSATRSKGHYALLRYI
ncbi:MAG: hypothetical protein ABW292_24345 [Vicinamibacterales bacterium]